MTCSLGDPRRATQAHERKTDKKDRESQGLMNCPRCSSELKAVPRDGIEIDVCPACRGVWLDAGELERLSNAEDDFYDKRRRDRNDRNRDDDDNDEEGGIGGFFRNLLGGLGD
jgi:Zn-finger nucleic acid-binding protein